MSGSLAIKGTLFSEVPTGPLGRGKELLFLQTDGTATTLMRGKAEQSKTLETRLHLVSEKVSSYLAAVSEGKEQAPSLEEKVTFFLHADQLEQCNIRRNEKIDNSVWLTILDIVVRILTLFFISVKQKLKNPLIDLPNKVDTFFGATPWKDLLGAFQDAGQFPKALMSRLDHRVLSAEQSLMTGQMKQNLGNVFEQFMQSNREFSIRELDCEARKPLPFEKRKKKVGEEKLSFDIDHLAKGGVQRFFFTVGKGEAECRVAFCKRGPIWEVLLNKQESLFLRRYASIPEKGGDLFIRTGVDKILAEITGGKGGGWALHLPVSA